MRKNTVLKVVAEVFGAILYGSGICCFLNPSNIAPGGVSGISIMANYLTGAPIGTVALLINIPVLILGFMRLDKAIIRRSVFSLILTSVIIDYVITPFFPVYSGDRLLGSVFGGVLMGAGLGFIFNCGSTTGGTDILSLLLKIKFPHLRIGIAMLLIDCIILTMSIFVFRDLESGLYGIIALFCATKLIDFFVYSSDRASLTFIISEHCEKIAEKILTHIDRGVTIIDATGGFTGKKIKIIMCAVRRQEFTELKKITFETDKNAFMTTAVSEGVFGEGFYKNKPF